MAVSTTLGRRAFLRSASAAATLTAAAAAVPLPGAHAATASSSASRSLPHTVRLPDGIRPEGITSGPGDRYYVGSLADGRIVTGDLRRGTSKVLLPGATGRQLRGLWFDRRSGLVWAAGNVEADAHVWAVRAWSGTVAHDIVVPDAVFLNDLVVTRRAVWVTDSRRDRLTRIDLDRDGHPSSDEPEFLELGGDWPAFDGTNINANGIRQLPDGSLVLNNSSAGGLWQVHPRTGEATEIPVSGGPGLTGGDGLELHDDVLYDVRGSGDAEVSVLRLTHDDGEWRARWVTALRDSTLDVPSTATLAAGSLWAVNARFGVASPETARYWITRLPTAHH
ncbi:hypothetical protein P0Y31_00865 [Knoellia sp. 3-2P3]|uniref:hypothetical protein n=1 Tax=unclassified Knoellia TaxID=2618719 RepID=UPI0023DB4274|nr:hypothetical protein [Knoellia sp. 3-2P3]MDF2090883.1 hypothetical protein [Knoellia sp. 3-2P3]